MRRSTGRNVIVWSSLYLFALIFFIFFGRYQVTYWFFWVVITTSLILLFKNLQHQQTNLPKIFSNAWTPAISLFIISLIFRVLFYPLAPSLSHDIESYILGGKFMSQGKPPFADEAVGNAYPPLPLFFFSFIYSNSSSLYGFKLLFILFDSLIPPLIFHLANQHSNK